MLHLNFTDFSLIEQLVSPDVPGCPRASISDMSALVVSEFCEVTQCYREEVKLEADGQTLDFELISPQADALVVGIFSARDDHTDFLPGDYAAHSSELLRFSKAPKNDVTVMLVLKPTLNAKTAPADIINRWADTIASGVRFRLMAMPGKPWSNPQLASYYRNEFDADTLKISADVVNQFSVVRTGRAKRNQSFFGV
jgi:hypothetical protein